MERIQDSITKELPPLRLYIDEITALYDLLLSCCKGPVVIKTCGYRLETPEELSKLPQNEANRISIECINPIYGRINIDLFSCYGNISIQENILETEGLASKIEKILLQGRVFVLDSLLKNWTPVIIGGVWLILFFISLTSENLFAFTFSFVPLCILIRELFFMFHHNKIIFLARKNSPNFWKLNKDKILVGLVCAVFGAVISKIIETIIIKYLH